MYSIHIGEAIGKNSLYLLKTLVSDGQHFLVEDAICGPSEGFDASRLKVERIDATPLASLEECRVDRDLRFF